MPRRPVGPVWHVSAVRITVLPDRRSPGHWLARAFDRATGKQTQTQHGSEADALRTARELVEGQRAGATGGKRPAESYTVGDLLTRYEKTRTTLNPQRRRSTVQNVAYRLGYIRAAFGGQPAVSVQLDDVIAWLGDLQQRLAPTTVNETFRLFRQIYGGAASLGIANPLAGQTMHATRTRPKHPWTPREMGLLLTAAREVWKHRPQYTLGLWIWMQSGLRAGEILALRDGAIDVTTGTVRLSENFSGNRLGPLKTPRKRPPFIILPTLSDGPECRPGATAESWRVVEAYEQLRVRSLLGQGFLCGATPDTPWCGTTMREGFQEIVARTGLPYREPEVFRHTMACLMLARGAPSAFVTDQGAWHSIAIVERIYAEYLPAAFTAAPRPGAELFGEQYRTVRRKRAK